ncbi:hypothetical protein LCGC14_1432440 [marine sediment metagenome]|uniref:Sucrose phosphatase-like domain-containing protein n=1 Tax=marine sediment metagenome TaxID=412755 RepID=A0A0F9K9E3_9ZZZZ
MLTIAIDFDDTFSADPDLWREFVGVATGRRYGHKCILVTNRPEAMGNDVRAEVGDLMPIVFAGRLSKKEAAARAGYSVDIWIDDNPEYVDVQGIRYVGNDRPDEPGVDT